VNDDQQQQAERIHQDMSFALKGLLPSVKAAIGRLDRLQVNNGRAGLAVPPFLLAHIAPQTIVDTLPGSIFAPSAEIAINGLPGRVLTRQVAPLAAGTGDIKRWHSEPGAYRWFGFARRVSRQELTA
jgi:hypothetical protein